MLGSATQAHLDRRLRVEQSEQRLPSVAAAVVRDGRLAWSAAAGTLDGRADGPAATPGTQYRIGSITKTFVAVQVMRLRDAGRLDLADRLAAHVPDTPVGDVTIGQLLSHTAGLQAETLGPWWERSPGLDWETLVSGRLRTVGRPGGSHHYSNLGYAFLGRVVESCCGTGWFAAVKGELLDPLGMTHTVYEAGEGAAPGLAVHPQADLVHVEPTHDARAMAPAGQLWSTVEDLAVWAAFLGGRTQDLLDPATLVEMARPLTLWDEPGDPWDLAHGLGLMIWNDGGRRTVGHGGSMPGFRASLRVRPSGGDGAVVLCNATSGLTGLAEDLLDLLAQHEPAAQEPWSVDPGERSLLDLTGEWYWGPEQHVLSLVSTDELELRPLSMTRGARFRATGPDRFVGVDSGFVGETLEVVRAADGSISHLDLATYCFTRTPYALGAPVPGGHDEQGWH